MNGTYPTLQNVATGQFLTIGAKGTIDSPAVLLNKYPDTNSALVIIAPSAVVATDTDTTTYAIGSVAYDVLLCAYPMIDTAAIPTNSSFTLASFVSPSLFPSTGTLNAAFKFTIQKLDKTMCCMGDSSTYSQSVCGALWANNAQCDSYMGNFCANNPTDSRCSCIEASSTSSGVNPKCFSAQCIQHGYLTANMKSTACPNIITCSQQVILQNEGHTVDTSIVPAQSCGNTTAPVVPTTTPTTTQTTANTSIFNDTYILYLVIFIVIISIIIAFVLHMKHTGAR
jgi:hypothetical protein